MNIASSEITYGTGTDIVETNVIFVYEDGTKSEPIKATIEPNPYYNKTTNGFEFKFNEDDNNYVL